MSFSIRLSSDTVTAEAGTTTAVSVEVTNRSIVSDRYELEIEGIDPEWKAIPVPVFPVASEETSTQKLFFKPPRASESTAGNYPFVVRVRSLESGESRTVQGVLAIQPFHHLSMEISPKKGVISPTRQQNVFVVSLVNLGNTEHTVRLQGNDPEDALAFEFDSETVAIGPGQQREIEAVAVPTSTSLISSARLIGFTVSGRSAEHPSVMTSSQAQLEQRSLFSPASLIVILIFVLFFALWLINRPKPPGFSAFVVQPTEVEMGSPVTIQWNSPDASVVHLYVDGQFYTDEPKTGEVTYPSPVQSEIKKDSITFEAVAERNGMKSEPQRATVHLHPPEVVDDPKILTIRVDHERVKLGDPFVLSYKFGPSVTKATLSPDNLNLDPTVPSISITPKVSGRQDYTVVAYNKLGKTVSRSFSVNVYDESAATIIQFTASPNPVRIEDGKTQLTWSVMKAVRVQIKADGTPLNTDETATSGSIEVPVTKKTTFTITAYDENGKPAIQSQIVSVVQPPKPPPTNPGDQPPVVPPSTAGGTAGGTTGGTDTTGGTPPGPR